MDIVVSSNNTSMEQLALQALENGLYVSGWSLRPWMQDIVDNGPEEGEQIAVAYEADVPVAVAYKHFQMFFRIYDWQERVPSIAVYVKPEYRRKGVGTKLIQSLTTRHFEYHQGAKGWEEFFRAAREKLQIKEPA